MDYKILNVIVACNMNNRDMNNKKKKYIRLMYYY